MRTGQLAVVVAGLGLAAGLGASMGTSLLGTALARETRPSAPAGLIATCDQFTVLQSMLGSPTYVKAREERNAKVASMTSDLDAQMAVLRDQMGKVTDKNSPEAKELQAKGQQLSQQMRAKKGEADRAVEVGNLKEVEEVYRLIVDASTAVAKRDGYTYVVGSRSLPVQFASQTLSGAFQEIYARPVIMAPAGVDITDAVMKELKVERLPLPGAADSKEGATGAGIAPAGGAPTDAAKPAGK
ncbi:MAG: OmpH family outer membrane protein [Phycisphaerae bacterium]|nr:OmpH family outer membrane protein [Phycisphaerae bacterium]